jgi:PAS domain S-box-containing protein
VADAEHMPVGTGSSAARTLLARLRAAVTGGGQSPDRPIVIISAAVIVVGVLILIGWILALPALTSWLTDGVQTKVNAAICLIGLGLAVGLSPRRADARPKWLASVVAGLVIGIAGATLFEHVTGISLGIDQAFVMDRASAAAPFPGRFAVQTCVAFLSAAFGVVAIGRRWRDVYPSEILGIICATVGGIGMLGYLYGAQGLLSLGSSTQVSLPTSCALVGIGVSLMAANPDHILVCLIRDPGIAGQVIRRIVPAVVIVVPVFAFIRLLGERAGLYDEAVGLAIMVVFEALVLVAVGAMTTVRVQRLEADRLQALSDLIRLGAAASTPLIETAPIGLAVLDRDLRYLYVNPALASIGGVSAVESLGLRIDRVVPAFALETASAFSRVLADGEPISDLEVSGQTRAGGQPRTWLVSAEVLRDAQGETAGLAVGVVDITERKRREEAVAAANELQRQARAIGELIPFGIWLADADGEMTYFSRSFLTMAGRTMDEARGSGWISTLAPEFAAATRHDWEATIATGMPWNHELIVQGASELRWTILSRGFPITDDSGEITSWAGINLDITDRKDAEAFREAFLGILSHELRTPVTSIFAASALLTRPGMDDSTRDELIGDIGHEAERLRRLVQDLVVLARAERGTIQVHTEPVLLQHVMRRVCEQERRRHPSNRVELTVAPAMPIARADEAFVEQIVSNLLENAAKYGPPGGRIDLVVDAPDGQPRVRVLDQGPGIDPAEAERLFEVFYRSERTSRVAGSGIGLFVAHRLVESIGGTIWARVRDDGPGAEFGFRLQAFADDQG